MIDDDDFCEPTLTQIQGVRSSMLLKLGQGQRRTIDPNLGSGVMDELCCKHRDDLLHIRHLAGT
ncbi:hypothetical protein TU74_17895 [Pseudomonas lundensis]|nr:hypothetical protein TU74_17895 [Pseudomonas lundensis]